MRTVIILGAMLIAEAINPDHEVGGTVDRFMVGVVISAMLMDLAEFFFK